LFPIGAIVCVWLATRLSGTMEVEVRSRARLDRSREQVVRLASLFSIDAFAGGYVVTVFMVFWFSKRFGASQELMSAVFFAAGLLQAASSIAASRVGAQFGLLDAPVCTHLPSDIVLILALLMPTPPLPPSAPLPGFAPCPSE